MEKPILVDEHGRIIRGIVHEKKVMTCQTCGKLMTTVGRRLTCFDCKAENRRRRTLLARTRKAAPVEKERPLS